MSSGTGPAERVAAGALLGCGLLALANLPAQDLPTVWLLAFTAPAAVLGLLQGRMPRQWQRATVATVLQLGAFGLALHFAEPLSRPAALACTILPPLAFVIVRRRDADAALGLFLSFCVLLVGVILDGMTPWLIGCFGACACLSLRSEAMLAAAAASHRGREQSQRVTIGMRALVSGTLLALPCLFATFAIDRTLALLPSPSRQSAAVGDAAAGNAAKRAGLDDSFRLDGGGGILADLHGEQLVLVRTGNGEPVPGDLYLRSGFFAVAGLDRWQIGTLDLQRRSAATDHVLRRRLPRAEVKWLEIERFAGARTFVFAPPHACELRGVPDLQVDAQREWLRQGAGSEQTDYAVGYQDLPQPGRGAALDARGERLGLLALPNGLDRAPFAALLLEWGATGDAMRIASRIADGLARHCRYDRQEPTGPHAHALLNFLFAPSDRHGYCMHFASAAALMLRMQGVPCRIGVGLYGGTAATGDPTARIYGSQHAHAWVEIPFADRGHVIFDPTPPAERGRPLPAAAPPVTPEADTPSAAAAGASFWAGVWAFATQPWFLTTLLLLAIAASMWPAGAAQPAARPAPPSAKNARRLLVRILQALGDAGHRRASGQTLEAFTRQFGADSPLAPEVLAAFAAYQEVRFGGRPFDVDRERLLRLGLDAAMRAPVSLPTAVV